MKRPNVPPSTVRPGLGFPSAARAVFLIACWIVPAFAQEAPPPPKPSDPCAVVKSIEVQGNQKMSADAVRFDLGIRPGDTWDDLKVRREFRRFWARGLFADLRFSKRCEPDGAVLVVEIQERPTLLSVTYEKNKVANQQQIEDFFKERNFTLTVGTPLDRKKIWKAVSLIEEMVGAKGFLDARVNADIKDLSPTARSVAFRIDPGGKTRIRKIEFLGNEAFSDRTLRRQLKLTSAAPWYWPFGRKSLYHPLKYQQDVNNILQYYKDRGYLDADVKPAIKRLQTAASRREEKRKGTAPTAPQSELERLLQQSSGAAPAAPEEDLRSTERKWVYLTSPIEEGPVYRLGDLKFSGNTVYSAEELRKEIPLEDAAVINDGRLEIGLSGLRYLYGKKGYVYAAVSRRFERREGENVSDVVINIDEDRAYTVRRIEFSGNSQTADDVLRREFNVLEGQILDRSQLNRSVLKLQQLGYWVPTGEPQLEPIGETAEVDVTVPGEEQSLNEIQVGGGYSEQDGGFFFARYDTKNFLGRGESLSFLLSYGGRANQASLNFVEPWFLGKPYTFGLSLYRRDLTYGRSRTRNSDFLTQKSTGGSITLGKRLGDFTALRLTYGYEQTEADSSDITSNFNTIETSIATLTPVFAFESVNNRLRPTSGASLFVTPQIAAKFLGGDNSYFRPRIEGSFYRPLGRSRLFVAMHGELAWIGAFGDQERRPGFIDGVPRFQRFFLGGDQIGPRVFASRSLSPTRFRVFPDQDGDPSTDPGGNPFVGRIEVGGSKSALAQFELGLPIGRTATLAGFYDIGGVYDDGVDIGWDEARASAGLEFRVFLPVFQAPIRLIYGWPVKEQKGDDTNNFEFSIGLPF